MPTSKTILSSEKCKTKQRRIQFYITEEEYGIIEAYAEHQSRGVSNFILHCALSEVRKRTKRLPNIKSYHGYDGPGYVYFVRTGDFVKIGLTVNIEKRLKDIGYNTPGGLDVIKFYEIDDMRKEEAKWHRVFESKRTCGEWFELNDNDIDYIRTKTPPYSMNDRKILNVIVFSIEKYHNVGKTNLK